MEIQCSEMLNTFVVQIVIEFVISLYILNNQISMGFTPCHGDATRSASNNET